VIWCPAIRHFDGFFRCFSDIRECCHTTWVVIVYGDEASDLQSEALIVIVEAVHEAAVVVAEVCCCS
jgi:hypothetical protein